MAAKVIVCSGCGAPAVSGRFACAECGGILAAVSGAPGIRRVAELSVRTDRAPKPAAGPVAGAVGMDAIEAPARSDDPAPNDEPAVPSGTRRDLPDQDDWADASPPWPEPSTAPWSPQPGPINAEDHVPAGAWLPPSAIFQDRGRPGPQAAGARSTVAADRAAPSAGHVGPDGIPGTAASAPVGAAPSAAWLDVRPGRQMIAAGAAVGMAAFLMPWANVLAGAGVCCGFFTQWGLAGPGHWIVVVVLGALILASIVSPRTRTWPIGWAATATAALLVGLAWPYLFGALGRSVGVFVGVAAALVLVTGGILDERDRHAEDRSAV